MTRFRQQLKQSKRLPGNDFIADFEMKTHLHVFHQNGHFEVFLMLVTHDDDDDDDDY